MSQRSARLGFWITTSFFSFMMAFTAYNELASPQVAEVFAHLGFPSHAFRLELSVAKVLGVLALLLPFVPCKLKEWAYAGFAITLGSALIAHVSMGDGPQVWSWAAGTGVLWGISYFFWRRLQANAGERLMQPRG